jgi:hypothetical protein
MEFFTPIRFAAEGKTMTEAIWQLYWLVEAKGN